MQSVDQLIHAKYILTCEESSRTLDNHSLAIKDGKILAILPTSEAKKNYQASSEHHYSTHAVMPGFINSHTHIAMNIFRGLADDLELMEWLTKHIWPAEGKWVGEELVYDASQLAMAEMIRCGTTCFNDMYFFLGSTAKAAEKTGIRAHIGITVIDVPTAWAKTTEEYFEKGIAFYEEYKNSKLVTATLAPHSTYTVSMDNLIKVKNFADKYKLKTNIHLQEAPSEIQQSLEKFKERPLQRLYNADLVTPDLIAIHMTQLNDDDFEILQKCKPSLVHCPESNMKLASGACPVEKLNRLGINVALGTDGAASNNDLNMIGEMKSAAFLGKLVTMDPKAVTADTVLKMATLHGAKALGIDHLTGSLTPGKAADFIALDLDQIETQPHYHATSAIVYAASRQQVTDVWVAGKQLMKNRELLTLDQQEIITKAKQWQEKISSKTA